MVAGGGGAAASAQRRFRLLLPVVLCGLGLVPAAPASGWGAAGHRIVGLVADELFDGRSRAALRDLAGGESLADIGLWMDCERPRLHAGPPDSERWHYDDRTVCRPAATAASYFEGGACASAVFSRYRAHLADHDLPRAERLLALRIVVHVLGDVHEPLHAACDTDFVKRAVRGESEAGFAHRPVLRHREDRGAIEAGDIAASIQES